MNAPPSLVDKIAAFVEAEKVELVDVEFVGGGAGRVLRITVDRPDGLDLGLITDLSHDLSRLLDEQDLVTGGRYALEVSSPGVERTLRTPAHFVRFIGSKVKVKTASDVEGHRRFEGKILSADEHSVLFGLVDERDKAFGERELRYEEIDKARTVFEWGGTVKSAKKVSR